MIGRCAKQIMLRVLSLGAGVQSTTLALMAAHGEIGPMPDCAIFADTGAEPKGVYAHLDWLEPLLPFPVHRVMKGEGYTRHLEQSVGRRVRMVTAPWHTDGKKPGMMPRICTQEFKIRPIQGKVRELLGIPPRARGPKSEVVEQWIGISMDEVIRMKPSGIGYIRHRWPLVEVGMNRRHCLAWLRQHGYPEPQKSACVFCPYHDDATWRRMRDQQPDDWAEAVRVDALLKLGGRDVRKTMFVHRQRVPLAEADLSTAEDRGQLDLFNNECEGMCGV
jgi:hypothetical protein